MKKQAGERLLPQTHRTDPPDPSGGVWRGTNPGRDM